MKICTALAAGLLCATVLFGAEEAPFLVRGVSAPNLAPGAILSIAGGFPGLQRCEAKADPVLRDIPNPRNPDLNDPRDTLARNTWVYPKQLCGVQVLINDLPAGLAYVSPSQINLKLPQDGPEGGTASLRVVYGSQSSPPLVMPAGWGRTTVELAEPAYVGMPVWLKVNLRYGLGRVMYPALVGPAGFCSNQVEVRRDGVLLPLLAGSDWMRSFGTISFLGGPVCGSIVVNPAKTQGRLPIHLLYRFDTPGTYEVRYTLSDLGSRVVRAQSDWTPIEILPGTQNQRRDYLDAVRKRAATDPGEILTDVLPGVLGFPDDESFEIVTSYLNDPSPGVRAYALAGLSYWPDDFRRQRLLELYKRDGPTPELTRYLFGH